jgi:hypothetical protein
VPDSPSYLVVRDAEGAPIHPGPGDVGGRPTPGDVAPSPPDFPAAQPLTAGAPLEAIDGLAAAVARIGRGPRVAGVILTGGLVSPDGPLVTSVRAQRILENETYTTRFGRFADFRGRREQP